jgi:hypothetical protein
MIERCALADHYGLDCGTFNDAMAALRRDYTGTTLPMAGDNGGLEMTLAYASAALGLALVLGIFWWRTRPHRRAREVFLRIIVWFAKDGPSGNIYARTALLFGLSGCVLLALFSWTFVPWLKWAGLAASLGFFVAPALLAWIRER